MKRLILPSLNAENKYFINYIVCLALIIGHFIFFLIFLLMQIKFLACLCAMGVMLYVFFLILLRKDKYIVMALILCILELMVIVFFEVYYLGWDSGFQFYVLIVIPVIFLTELFKTNTKVCVTICCIAVYIIYHRTIQGTAPIIFLTQSTVKNIGDLNTIIVFSGLAVIMYNYRFLVIRSEHTLKEKNKSLDLLAKTDQLTGLYNRRYMIDLIEERIHRYYQSREPFVVAIADIDNYKVINDSYGHECGDLALKAIVQRFSKVIRHNDIVARWGGEEFLFLLTNTDLHGGVLALEKVRQAIENTTITCNGLNFTVTLTIGLAEYKDNWGIRDLLRLADECMYKGKKSGKNCVVS